MRGEGLSLVEMCVTSACARSRGVGGGGRQGGAESKESLSGERMQKKIHSREQEQSAIPLNDSPPG